MLRLLAAGVALVHVQAAKEPLISTDILYATYDLIADAGAHAYKVANVDALIAQVPVDHLKKEILKQTGPLPPQVDDAVLQANAAYVQIRALIAENTQKAYEPANTAAIALIEQFEAKMPSYKGLIPKTLGNFALFVCYKLLVLYIVLKVLLFALRTVLGIFSFFVCLFCCCRCGSKGAAKAGKKANGKSDTKKAAPAPAGKAAAKAAGKKK